MLKIYILLQNVQDELEDMLDQSNEVQEALGRSYGMPEVDDDELEAGMLALTRLVGTQNYSRVFYIQSFSECFAEK